MSVVLVWVDAALNDFRVADILNTNSITAADYLHCQQAA